MHRKSDLEGELILSHCVKQLQDKYQTCLRSSYAIEDIYLLDENLEE